MFTRRNSPAAASLFLSLVCPAVQAETIVGLTTNDQLVHFDSANPGTILQTVNITGINGTLVGIDFRPATGELYGLSILGTLYTINPATGAAGALGGGGPITLDLDDDVGFDFNPVVDRIRLVDTEGANARLNPNPGSAGLAATDGNLAYDATTDDGDPIDVNAGQVPQVDAIAYTNSFAGAASTTLYVIDDEIRTLTIQNPPNAGVLNTVAPLTGLDVPGFSIDVGDMDISGASGIAYLVTSSELIPDRRGPNRLYMLNLSSGAATLVGEIPLPGTIDIQDIAVVPEPSSVVALLLTCSAPLLRRRHLPKADRV